KTTVVDCACRDAARAHGELRWPGNLRTCSTHQTRLRVAPAALVGRDAGRGVGLRATPCAKLSRTAAGGFASFPPASYGRAAESGCHSTPPELTPETSRHQ